MAERPVRYPSLFSHRSGRPAQAGSFATVPMADRAGILGAQVKSEIGSVSVAISQLKCGRNFWHANGAGSGSIRTSTRDGLQGNEPS
jgi:hypothetical protein